MNPVSLIELCASKQALVRTNAFRDLRACSKGTQDEKVIETFKKGLQDPCKNIRRASVEALFETGVDRQRKIREFLPLVLPLLNDHSIKIRRNLPWLLAPFADALSPELIEGHLKNEPDQETTDRLRSLLVSVREAHGYTSNIPEKL